MTNERIARWLGSEARDPGCDECFEVLDQYADALLRGADAAELFPEVIAHLEGCVACREDTAGLLAALGDKPPDDDAPQKSGSGSR